MLNPVATYRVQLHKEFNFDELKKIIPYLQEIGIGTLYASPVFEAVPGSTHGYDGLHPHRINPEIGTIEQLKEISSELSSAGIGWLQDIVPNHMGFHPGNEWLMDVLRNGEQSKYASFFDIDWTEKLMVPFLGSTVEDAIANKELKVVLVDGRPMLQYYESHYPLNTSEKPGDDISGEALRTIIDAQHYRLCGWNETDRLINYRRFFTINGLICLNVQDETVFDAYHKLVGQLTREGVFSGLRVDHVDGLYDPSQYLSRLRELAGEETHITVEKILQPGESLPQYWNIQGNTGYDFLAVVNNVFTNMGAQQAFTEFYQQLTNDYRPIELHIQNKKAQILYNHMQGELDNLFRLFRESNLVNKRSFASLRQDDLKEAIAEFLIHCPVYRYYGSRLPLGDEESGAVQAIFNKIRNHNGDLHQAVGLLEQAILHNPHHGDDERNERAAHFYKRIMQFTGPLMAKGVEDTLMYTYNRFIAHSEVGDQPSAFGISIDAFHDWMVGRQQQWPYSLNATSTHDTKRGEDQRARLNVLTDLPDWWTGKITEWQNLNKESKGIVDNNDEYFIYQSLIGGYPFDQDEIHGFKNRVTEYLRKALREAKVNSNWTDPNEEYENAVAGFIGALLEEGSAFREQIREAVDHISDHGIINSLSQLVLKFTCPGVPDIYQGCEGWDLSFVDPDNRRAVDYSKRSGWLSETAQLNGEHFPELWNDRYSGKIKLWLTHRLLKLRTLQPELLSQGDYIPLQTEGTYKRHILSFARKYRQKIFIVAVPLHTAAICAEQNVSVRDIDWKDTRILLPHDVDAEWDDYFTEAEERYKGEVKICEAFHKTPFLVWQGRLAIKERSAGILLHITSLPSPYGIGDIGTEAKSFADFLYRSKQKYWQLLPLNPTEAGQGHSPYSAISGMAGNTLLISPDRLMKEGLLDQNELNGHHLPNEGKVNYPDVFRSKQELLDKAFYSFLKADNRKDFEEFCQQESYWLDDFALFAVLKQLHQGAPWFEWTEDYKLRNDNALKELTADHADELYRVKWLQYVFSKQWKELKTYCNERNVSLIGDLPIYVSYDSADVWANREIFAIDTGGRATGVAGVPPDAFSADGQLWGMPVFKWDVLKERNYDWWIARIRRNRELFDIIRIDHFRAFESYWEVPAGESTAKNGEWKTGPGKDFFAAVQDALGELPFIAEDLGDVDDNVFALRDAFNLPGMKVLQFAFGNDLPHSVHIPHNHSRNFVVYTGTHDNNTTRGWYRTADEETRKLFEQYAARSIGEDDAHWVLARMAYASVARIAILPMQDVLNLDESARMNIPASKDSNWAWRLVPGQLNRSAEDKLREWVWLYNR